MAPHYKTAVAQFHIADGLWQETAENMRIIEPHPIFPFGGRKDRLYLLLEPVGAFQDAMATCQQVADCIERTYVRSRGSVTARLRVAVQVANKMLFEENLKAPADQRGVLGMTCAVLHGDGIYLAQAGPALAYVVREGELQRFPADSPWLSSKAPRALDARQALALGWRKDCEPDLFYCQLQPEDLVVLCSTHLVRVATETEIVEALAYQDSQTALGNLEGLAENRELSAVIVEILSGAAVREKAPAPTPARQARKLAERLQPAEETQIRPARQGRAGREEEAGYQPAAVRKPGRPGYVEESPAGEGPSSAVAFLSSLGQKMVAIWQGLWPERDYGRRRARRTVERGPSWSILKLALAALIIPLLVVALFTFNHLRLQRAREAEWADKLGRARQLATSAETGTTAEQRQALQEATALVSELLSSQPNNQEAQALRDKIERQADVVNKVTRIHFLGELAKFLGADQPVLPNRLVVHREEVYVLDTAAGRVSKFSLDESGERFRSQTPEIVLDPSTSQGGSVPKKIVDMVCIRMALGPDDGKLLILTQDGTILERGGQPPQLIPRILENSQALLAPKAIETYYDTPNLYFYILDTKANLIKKYQVSGNIYSDTPEDYAPPDAKISFQDAIDLAIDGSIYVLLKGGQILKLFQGKAVDFPQEGLDEPLKDPVAISVSAPESMEKGAVYVADAGNQRIVQFDKKGRFIRQFRPAAGRQPLNDLRDIFASEATRRIFLLNGPALYFINVAE